MTNKMSENDEISTTIAVRLSEIHQQLSKQLVNIERIAQKLSELNLSQNDAENCHDNSSVVIKKSYVSCYILHLLNFLYIT